MIQQSIKMAWSAISASKMRTFLTMLGIIIGVVALVVLVSLVSSATTSVTDQVSSLGTNMLTVSISDDKGNPLRLSELSDYMEEDSISLVAPVGQLNGTAKSGRDSVSATIYGTTPSYEEIQGLSLGQGRFLKSTDVDNASYVAVISSELAEELFGHTDVLVETISFDGRRFLIVGILEEDSSMTSSFRGNNIAYIPYTVAMRMSTSISNVSSFYVKGTDANSMDAAEETMESLMLTRFKQDEDAYTISNQSALMDTMTSITDTLSLLLGGIAAISLLVGGIGIMNIMLVSVTERTREIGIRKAIGATRRSILTQFLIEALMISLIGCAIGIFLSYGIIQVASLVAGDQLTFHLSGSVVVIAVLFSLFIGVVFGIYPAQKAAKKQPIEALRYE
ncbi:ABC transporter permease [Eubacteriales bacterium OttesenSCG-928-M02]|nr:ABC transporter permease [Eubacteriales bacterium OttesenSCG-928-M02]